MVIIAVFMMSLISPRDKSNYVMKAFFFLIFASMLVDTYIIINLCMVG